ncbi:MAG: DUF4367 domain-containing protein [Lachnospiraceae bacterium]|nr:DUF4367 domain-containing protein [Lachnospiraceae bacterium]
MRRKNENRQEEEAMKSMAALLQEYELSRIPEKEELKERYQLSDFFNHNMDKIIEKQGKKIHRRSVRRRWTAAAAGILIFFCITNPRVAAKGAEWLVYWFKDHVSFQFKEDTDVNWVPRYEFGYIPEGFEKVMDDYSDPGGYILYQGTGELWFDLDYGVIDGALNVDNENKDYLMLTGSHGEKIHYLRAQIPGEDSSLTWVSEDETTKFNLMGNLSEEELLKMQENIRIIE